MKTKLSEVENDNRTYEVDYLGVMSFSEIHEENNGFNVFQKQKINTLGIGESVEFMSTDLCFNVVRLS